jgi:hypothetical protein
MTDDDGKKRRDKKNPKWLKKAADDVIAQDVLIEPLDVKAVARHLLERSEYPMPEDHLKVLAAWLEVCNEVRLTRIGSGRNEAEWYSLADRLVENGLSVLSACELAKKHFGLAQDIANMETMFKRHLRNRSKHVKRMDALVGAILSSDDDKIEKAVDEKKGT